MIVEKNTKKMNLPTLDDLFSTQEERDIANLEKIENISLDEIDDFPEHPFKVINNEEMQDMADSIKTNGVLVPAIVRKKENGRYEMISGHRRKFASHLAGLETLPCVVRDYTDDEATIMMVDSNKQRETILPSEKAFAYKMRLDAIKRQAGRPKNNSTPVVHNFENKPSIEIIGEEVGESREQIRRYIRLTYLLPKLLTFVDNDIIKDKDIPSMGMRPAVEISYLTQTEQKCLLEFIEANLSTPSHDQARQLRSMSESKVLSPEKIWNLMSEDKPNQRPRLQFNENKIRNALPSNIPENKIEDFLLKSIEFYTRHLKNRVKDER